MRIKKCNKSNKNVHYSIHPLIHVKLRCCITDNPWINTYYLFITWITGQTVWSSSIDKCNAYTSLEEGAVIAVQQSIDLDF